MGLLNQRHIYVDKSNKEVFEAAISSLNIHHLDSS